MFKEIVASVMLAGCAYARGDLSTVVNNPSKVDSSDIKETSRDNIPLSYMPHLVVNTKNTDRKVSFLSEDEGIADIKKLVDESGYEEAWVFNPKDKIWIETGYNETGWVVDSMGVRTGLSLDSLYILKLFDSLDSVVEYHFHPMYDYPNNIYDSLSRSDEIKKNYRYLWNRSIHVLTNSHP